MAEVLQLNAETAITLQKAVDLATPGKNRDKMSGKKWHFQIKKVIPLVRKFT